MNLIKALTEAQKEMGNPPLNGYAQISQSRSYKYALLADVEAAVKPPLMERGVFITQKIGEDNRLHTIAYLGEESMELDNRPVMCEGAPQDNGKAETYAKRYALCSVFCIVGEEDTDAQGIDAPTKADNPVENEKAMAKVRLNEAVAVFCKRMGGTVEDVKKGIRARPDFMDSAAFYNKVAYEYEQMNNG